MKNRLMREFLNTALLIEDLCINNEIECDECVLRNGSMCDLHGDLVDEYKFREEEIKEELYENIKDEVEEGTSLRIEYDENGEVIEAETIRRTEILLEVLMRIEENEDEIKNAYGSDLICEIDESVVGGEGKEEWKERRTFLYFSKDLPLFPIAMFGIEFDILNNEISIREILDFGGRM